MEPVQRIALGVRYDGSNYHGWQNQEGLNTVQFQLEKALTSVANHPVAVVAAGRTDAGVHATGQVLHFDSHVNRNDHAWVFGANSNLPADISIVWSKHVWLDFHARFSALVRRYKYVIYNHEIRPGILRNAVSWFYRLLDEEKMRQTIPYLLGEHDFSAFRGAGCQSKTAIRQIFHIEIQRHRRLIIIDIQANAFLLHMVRNIAGVLMAIGSGSHPPEWAKEVLEGRDRRYGGFTASPKGLYLVEVGYPSEFDLPTTSIGPFFLP